VSEIIFRLPSKAVQYGYIEVKLTSEDLGAAGVALDPQHLGAMYMSWVLAFKEGEERQKKAAAPPDPQLVDTSLAEHNLKRQPMTEPTQEEAQAMISQGLDEKAPWDETVTADPKPWEKKQSAPRPTVNLLDTL